MSSRFRAVGPDPAVWESPRGQRDGMAWVWCSSRKGGAQRLRVTEGKRAEGRRKVPASGKRKSVSTWSCMKHAP